MIGKKLLERINREIRSALRSMEDMEEYVDETARNKGINHLKGYIRGLRFARKKLEESE